MMPFAEMLLFIIVGYITCLCTDWFVFIGPDTNKCEIRCSPYACATTFRIGDVLYGVCANGEIRPPLKRHDNSDSAEKEAIRLAEKEKDAFFILKTVDCYAPTKVESISLEHEDATGDLITHCDFIRGKCMNCGGDLPKLQRDVAIDWECDCGKDYRAVIKIAAPWSPAISKFLNSYAWLTYDERCVGCGKKLDPTENTYEYHRHNHVGKQCENCFVIEEKNSYDNYLKRECYGCIGPSEGINCNTCQSDKK